MFCGHDKPPTEGFGNQKYRCNYITICYLAMDIKCGTLNSPCRKVLRGFGIVSSGLRSTQKEILPEICANGAARPEEGWGVGGICAGNPSSQPVLSSVFKVAPARSLILLVAKAVSKVLLRPLLRWYGE